MLCQSQYTIPKELKTKLLGIKSLAKHKDDFNMNSLICLNTGLNGAPIYAMELKDNVKLKNEKELDSDKNAFIKTKLFEQNRLIYRMADGFGNIKNYVVLDSSITNQYTTNQYAQKILQNKETELQLGNVSSTFGKLVKTENALCEQIKSVTPAIFNGNILNQNAQNAFKILGLPLNRQYETDTLNMLYYTNEKGEKVFTGLSLAPYPVITLSLINYQKTIVGSNIDSRSILEKALLSIDTDTNKNRARFFFKDDKCYYTENVSELKTDKPQNIEKLKERFEKIKNESSC